MKNLDHHVIRHYIPDAAFDFAIVKEDGLAGKRCGKDFR